MNWQTFPMFLSLILITLKLCEIIDYSWFIVTIGLWFGPAVVLAIVVIIPTGAFIAIKFTEWIEGLKNVFKR